MYSIDITEMETKTLFRRYQNRKSMERGVQVMRFADFCMEVDMMGTIDYDNAKMGQERREHAAAAALASDDMREERKRFGGGFGDRGNRGRSRRSANVVKMPSDHEVELNAAESDLRAKLAGLNDGMGASVTKLRRAFALAAAGDRTVKGDAVGAEAGEAQNDTTDVKPLAVDSVSMAEFESALAHIGVTGLSFDKKELVFNAYIIYQGDGRMDPPPAEDRVNFSHSEHGLAARLLDPSFNVSNPPLAIKSRSRSRGGRGGGQSAATATKVEKPAGVLPHNGDGDTSEERQAYKGWRAERGKESPSASAFTPRSARRRFRGNAGADPDADESADDRSRRTYRGWREEKRSTTSTEGDAESRDAWEGGAPLTAVPSP